MLDRWELVVEKNPDAQPCSDDQPAGQSRDTLPLSVVNNYFSFGVDAQIALDFHEARGNGRTDGPDSFIDQKIAFLRLLFPFDRGPAAKVQLAAAQ